MTKEIDEEERSSHAGFQMICVDNERHFQGNDVWPLIP